MAFSKGLQKQKEQAITKASLPSQQYKAIYLMAAILLPILALLAGAGAAIMHYGLR